MATFYHSSRQALTLLVLAVLPCSVVSSVDSSTWRAAENENTWEDYPSSLDQRLDMEIGMDRSLVNMTLYQTYPETTQVWPFLKGMIRRTGVHPSVIYYVESGLDFGCRQVLGNGQEVEIETDHCYRHCTHSGRYCAAHSTYFQGRHAASEIARRLCLAEFTSGAAFTDYLEKFQYLDCLNVETGKGHLCSLNAMHLVDINVTDALLECLEPDWHKDQPHQLMERNLKRLWGTSDDKNATVAANSIVLPQLEITSSTSNEEPTILTVRDEEEWTTRDIFAEYCGAFPTCVDGMMGAPLACHACAGCNDVQTCLWTLQCDGRPSLDGGTVEEIISGEADKSKCEATEEPVKVTTPPTAAPTDAKKTNAPTATTTTATLVTLSSPEEEEPSSGGGGMIFLVIVVVAVVVAVALAICFRQAQARREKETIIQNCVGTEDFYSDHAVVGKSVKPPTKNLAPRPSEDPLQEQLDAISFESLYTDDNKRKKKGAAPPNEFFQNVPLDKVEDGGWV